jgi:hypothetical protein
MALVVGVSKPQKNLGTRTCHKRTIIITLQVHYTDTEGKFLRVNQYKLLLLCSFRSNLEVEQKHRMGLTEPLFGR